MYAYSLLDKRTNRQKFLKLTHSNLKSNDRIQVTRSAEENATLVTGARRGEAVQRPPERWEV
eukprot:SAG31_NODE_23003_length_513_cov_1.248792_2_plen_61_part_01